MAEVLITDEFETWWEALSEAEQESVNAVVLLLESQGVTLGYPHSSKIAGSRHNHMRELLHPASRAALPSAVCLRSQPRRPAVGGR